MAAKGTKKKKTKPIMGRRTCYRIEYVEQVYKLSLLGAIDKQIADFFGVTEVTINRWKLKHLDFCLSIKRGKAQADAEVAEQLYHRAKGYEHPETKVFCTNGEITTFEVVKHYPPETAAIAFWLKNRQKDIWRDSKDLTTGGQPIESLISVNVTKNGEKISGDLQPNVD